MSDKNYLYRNTTETTVQPVRNQDSMKDLNERGRAVLRIALSSALGALARGDQDALRGALAEVLLLSFSEARASPETLRRLLTAQRERCWHLERSLKRARERNARHARVMDPAARGSPA